MKALYYRLARGALRDARSWLSARLPPTMVGAELAEVSAVRSLTVCTLLVEAESLRAKARGARA